MKICDYCNTRCYCLDIEILQILRNEWLPLFCCEDCLTNVVTNLPHMWFRIQGAGKADWKQEGF